MHATLLAGLGDRSIPEDGEKMKNVTQEAVERWRTEEGQSGKLKAEGEGEGLRVELKDVVTRGSYFQVCTVVLSNKVTLLLWPL